MNYHYKRDGRPMNPYRIFHLEGSVETIIAYTDTAEKADLIVKCLNNTMWDIEAAKVSPTIEYFGIKWLNIVHNEELPTNTMIVGTGLWNKYSQYANEGRKPTRK